MDSSDLINAWWFFPLMIWTFAWKGWGLWRAARNDSKTWFVAILILNTIGLLEIIYIFLISSKKSLNK